MNNPEWQKTMNSLLSQVMKLSESNPSIEKILELANNAAKQLDNKTLNSFTPSFTKEGPKVDRSPAETNVTNSTGNATSKIEVLITSLGNLLDLANSAVKQISAIMPLLPVLMKGQATTGQSSTPPWAGKLNTNDSAFNGKTFTNFLLSALLLFFLLNFVWRFLY